MRVILSKSVFTDPQSSPLALGALFYLSLEGLHRVVLDEDAEPAFEEWVQAFPQHFQDECRFALNCSYELNAREPSRHELLVVASSSQNLASFQVSVETATAILQKPFILRLENDRNDWAFLLWFCSPEKRKFLEEMRSLSRLVVEGGGSGELRVRVEAFALLSEMEKLHCAVLFDSDARHPGDPSPNSRAILQICQRAGLFHGMLSRRESENYIPLAALHRWAVSSAKPHERNQRRERTRAFAMMLPEQRYHFNMCFGFERDQVVAPQGLFCSVSAEVFRILHKGFGRDIGDLFGSEEYLIHDDLRRDGSWLELSPWVDQLISRIQ